jgi:manganese/zinc/iron transport system ATP- binding protein
MDKVALHVEQLTVNYGNNPALWDVTLEIPSGNVVGIIGPNGAGKTTFIKTALGLIQPLSGKVEFFGQPLGKMRQKIGYIPQRESVDWDFPITVRDLVLMGRYGQLGMLRWPREADRAAVEHYLERVGMLQYADRQINELSGGQKQRVFIARALVQEADIYFMDEPFVGIDLATKKVIVDLLHELKKEGKTVFVVHHELDQVDTYFDWVIVFNIRLIACGPVQEAFTTETLNAAYGKSYAIFDEALKLARSKTKGLL